MKNQCQALGLPIAITGSATPVDAVYGEAGAFEVTFFNASNTCPGPNYIVQGKCSATKITWDRMFLRVLQLTQLSRICCGRLCYCAVAGFRDAVRPEP